MSAQPTGPVRAQDGCSRQAFRGKEERSPRVGPANLLVSLRRLAQGRAVRERCDLCSLALAPGHRHLLEMAGRRLVCACDACALRFQDVIGGKFRLVPREARALPGFGLTDAHWERLALPINLAFFYHDTARGRTVALYPSPAGATESLLSLESWQALVAENPGLAGLEPDVEALLVNRVGEARECFIAPMDRCYELVGLIRTQWRGLSGGDVVWREIAAFFGRLREQAGIRRALPEVSRA
jgi:hypothetical protein